MDQKKQIEEMAKELCGMNRECKDCNMDSICISQNCASIFYKLGYRKQSEGKWQKRGNEKKCSHCGFIYYSNNDDWSFCPNCGAKMKGGAE